MLIEFKVANFRSFRDEQTLSMVASKQDKSHLHSLISDDKIPGSQSSLAKTAAIYGPNASGKSNLINAMRLMDFLVCTSATQMNLGDRIDLVSPFRLDVETQNEPSRFEITVLIEDVTYYYGFSVTQERVHDEWLFVRPLGGRMSRWLERTFDSTRKETDWQIRGPLRKDAKLLRSRTRDNGLLLSRGAELNIEPLARLFLWFKTYFWVFDLSFSPKSLAQATAHVIGTNEKFRSRILEMLRDADFGIYDFGVEEIPARDMIPDTLPDDLRKALRRLTSEDASTAYQVYTTHRTVDTEKDVRFSLDEDESRGTQRFFALAGPIIRALEDGHLLVIDELDCSMHPLLSRKIIELFQSEETNTNGAQLVFATHDSSLMDSALLRRDQIWLTEKLQNGSTDLFSLYDFTNKPRQAEALERNYLAGRYGAIPSFGPSLEDMEVE